MGGCESIRREITKRIDCGCRPSHDPISWVSICSIGVGIPRACSAAQMWKRAARHAVVDRAGGLLDQALTRCSASAGHRNRLMMRLLTASRERRGMGRLAHEAAHSQSRSNTRGSGSRASGRPIILPDGSGDQKGRRPGCRVRAATEEEDGPGSRAAGGSRSRPVIHEATRRPAQAGVAPPSDQAGPRPGRP
jgi:hypothetical protein